MTMSWIPLLAFLAIAPAEENPMTLKMTLHEMSLKAQALPEELSPERLEEVECDGCLGGGAATGNPDGIDVHLHAQ